MSRLIINADDFGVTGGVNRAIAELHEAGVLTSATLMARAAASDEAAGMALRTPTLGVGCHVVLVDGEPTLAPDAVPSLIDKKTGRLHATLGEFVRRLLTGRIREAEIEAEAAAQIATLRARGVRLTHIDTHKHTHMFPWVLRPVLQASRSAGIRAVRNPFEPEWSLRATPAAPLLRRLEVRGLRTLSTAFRRLAAENAFTTTDGAIGVLATGTLDAATVESLMKAMPEGTWELVTHPGYNDADLARVRTRLRASREVERAALGSIAQFPAVELVTFAELGADEHCMNARC